MLLKLLILQSHLGLTRQCSYIVYETLVPAVALLYPADLEPVLTREVFTNRSVCYCKSAQHHIVVNPLGIGLNFTVAFTHLIKHLINNFAMLSQGVVELDKFFYFPHAHIRED